MELQFWGYEIGNVLAAIAGVGGFLTFYKDLALVKELSWQSGQHSLLDLLTEISALYPDIVVIIGICLIALIAPLIRKLIVKCRGLVLLNIWDVLYIFAAITLVVFAIKSNTSWIAVSGSSFVVASSLLRFSHDNPVFLKLGAIFLQLGGFALSLFGVRSLLQSSTTLDGVLGLLICLTGYYVFAAGTLTYEGGVYKTRTVANDITIVNGTNNDLANRLLNPATGALSLLLQNILDNLNSNLVHKFVNPSLFWISESEKREKPFLTSMKARLPWRLLTALAALSTGTQSGVALAAANFCWAIGDVSIGSLDWAETIKTSDKLKKYGNSQSTHQNHNRMLTPNTIFLTIGEPPRL